MYDRALAKNERDTVKKGNDLSKKNLTGPQPAPPGSPRDKKASIFDESFFDDDDDDFDFDDEDEDKFDLNADKNDDPRRAHAPSAGADAPPAFAPMLQTNRTEQGAFEGPSNPAPMSAPEPFKPTEAPREEVTREEAPRPGSAAAKEPQTAPEELHLEDKLNLLPNAQFRLSCEIGQVLVPYENLQQLNVGRVVPFNNTLQTLYLSLNDVRVGEGMIVDIDGKIGVKITRWYAK